MNIDKVAFWKSFADRASETEQSFKPKGDAGEQKEGAEEVNSKQKAAADRAALLLSAQMEGEFLLHPLAMLLNNQVICSIIYESTLVVVISAISLIRPIHLFRMPLVRWRGGVFALSRL
jgi:hypothetical protein